MHMHSHRHRHSHSTATTTAQPQHSHSTVTAHSRHRVADLEQRDHQDRVGREPQDRRVVGEGLDHVGAERDVNEPEDPECAAWIRRGIGLQAPVSTRQAWARSRAHHTAPVWGDRHGAGEIREKEP